MSPAERTESIKGEKEQVRTQRESRKVGSHNVLVSSYNDFRISTEQITTQVRIPCQ